MAWNPNGLNPNYWTRWRYFKEIQLWEFAESMKFIGMVLVTAIAVVVTFIVVAPIAVFKEWRERRADNTHSTTK